MKLREVLSCMNKADYIYISSESFSGGVDKVSAWEKIGVSSFLDASVISISSIEFQLPNFQHNLIKVKIS